MPNSLHYAQFCSIERATADIKELEKVKAPEHGDPELVSKTGTKPKKPSMYHVVLLNDDFTPMDFVVAILIRFFHKGPEEAAAVMMEVHKKGRAIAGTYTLEVCETKALEVIGTARAAEHPLLAVVQEA